MKCCLTDFKALLLLQTSMIFDIMLPGVSDGTVMHHTSVASAKPIKPYSLKVPGATLSNQSYQPCQLCILSMYKSTSPREI